MPKATGLKMQMCSWSPFQLMVGPASTYSSLIPLVCYSFRSRYESTCKKGSSTVRKSSKLSRCPSDILKSHRKKTSFLMCRRKPTSPSWITEKQKHMNFDTQSSSDSYALHCLILTHQRRTWSTILPCPYLSSIAPIISFLVTSGSYNTT